jgi:hypothetical protein
MANFAVPGSTCKNIHIGLLPLSGRQDTGTVSKCPTQHLDGHQSTEPETLLAGNQYLERFPLGHIWKIASAWPFSTTTLAFGSVKYHMSSS